MLVYITLSHFRSSMLVYVQVLLISESESLIFFKFLDLGQKNTIYFCTTKLLKRRTGADVGCTEDGRDGRIGATRYAGGNGTRKEAEKRNV